MAKPPARNSHYVRTQQLMPAVPTARALTFAGIAALLGAAAWGLVSFYGHFETGWLAWGIGAFVGFAAVKAGGHGNLIALAAGALTLLSIGTGKQLAFQLAVDQGTTRFLEEHITPAAHQERSRDAADWVALGERPTSEQVQAFAEDHGYDPSDPTAFAAEEGPRLRDFAEQKPSLEQWRDHIRGTVAAEASFLDHLRSDFHPADILFVLLGIASAFGLVSNYTTRLHVAVREAERQRRDAEAEAEAPPPAE